MKYTSAAEFAAYARSGKAAGQGVALTARAAPGAGDTGRKIRFVLSDATVDRMGDTIALNGWKLDEFRKNPVALWAHDSSSPPIGRVLDVKVEGGKLVGDVEFADADTYQFAGEFECPCGSPIERSHHCRRYFQADQIDRGIAARPS
jgi:hypothetical protein